MPTVLGVTSHFPTAKEGFATTLSGSIASGAATVGLNSTTGYSDGDVVVLVVDPADAVLKQAFTGIVSGTTITDVVWTEGTDQAHSAGATVVDYVSATHMAMTTKGLLVQHTQAGAHKAITATSLTTTGNTAVGGTLAVTGTSTFTGATTLPNNDIAASELATNAITLGYSQSVVNQSVAVIATQDFSSMSVAVTVPAGGRRCKITGYIPSATATAANNAITLSIREGATVLATARTNVDNGKTEGSIVVMHSAVLTAGAHTYKVSISQDVASNVDYAMSATSPGFILVEAI